MRAFLLAAALFVLPSLSYAQSSAVGLWLTQSGNAAVEVADCGHGVLCGKIAWLRDPLDEVGKPKTDRNNPAADLKSQKLCGLLMVGNFEASGPNRWGNGFIYNPEDGKTYASEMELKSADVLAVRGYVGIPLFGKSQTWTRLPNDHARCKA
jgi:uncharacterized protein (DUF2147 family)